MYMGLCFMVLAIPERVLNAQPGPQCAQPPIVVDACACPNGTGVVYVGFLVGAIGKWRTTDPMGPVE